MFWTINFYNLYSLTDGSWKTFQNCILPQSGGPIKYRYSPTLTFSLPSYPVNVGDQTAESSMTVLIYVK